MLLHLPPAWTALHRPPTHRRTPAQSPSAVHAPPIPRGGESYRSPSRFGTTHTTTEQLFARNAMRLTRSAGSMAGYRASEVVTCLSHASRTSASSVRGGNLLGASPGASAPASDAGETDASCVLAVEQPAATALTLAIAIAPRTAFAVMNNFRPHDLRLMGPHSRRPESRWSRGTASPTCKPRSLRRASTAKDRRHLTQPPHHTGLAVERGGIEPGCACCAERRQRERDAPRRSGPWDPAVSVG